jgi:hypothetical protein
MRTDPSQLLRHAVLGMRLLRLGRMSLRRERVRAPAQISKMFDALEATEGGAA